MNMGILKDINGKYESEEGFFNCPVVRLSQLTDRMFYVLDYTSGAKTKFGEGRCVVKISGSPEDDPSLHRKFLTNSKRLKYTLDLLRECNALPYRVTLKYDGHQYYFDECENKDSKG